MSPVTAHQRYFFVHLQKTAGSTLFRRVRAHIGPEAVYPRPEYQFDPKTAIRVDLLCERFEQHRDELRFINGHFPLCVVDLLRAPFTIITVLREPVERTLSFLRHRREVGPPAEREMTLEQIYEQPQVLHGLIHNHMVKMFSLRSDEIDRAAALTFVSDFGEARLNTAKDNLTTRVDILGLQERFEDFCDELAARSGWDLGPPQFANSTQPLEVEEGLRARIERDNALDVELYRFAVELVDSRRPVEETSDSSWK